MFYEVPVSEKTPKPATTGAKAKSSPRAAKSYGVWQFTTYKEARSFAWTKIFCYPENAYITRQVDGIWTVIEGPRKKPEPMD
jgi:hypothetical protein